MGSITPLESFYKNFFGHHGVPGMKWGVRKDRRSGGSGGTTIKKKKAMPAVQKRTPGRKTAASKVKPGQPAKKQGERTTTGSPVERVSDEKLRKMVNRLQMEKQYADLTRPQASQGKKFVSEVLSNSGKQVATTFVTAGSTYLLKKAIEGKYGKQVVSDMFPKKGK